MIIMAGSIHLPHPSGFRDGQRLRGLGDFAVHTNPPSRAITLENKPRDSTSSSELPINVGETSVDSPIDLTLPVVQLHGTAKYWPAFHQDAIR